jgi:hypothetical protein
MDTEHIVRKLEELRDNIKDWETRQVGTKDSAEFTAWNIEVEDWLRQGGTAVGTELMYFANMMFCAPKAQLPGGAFYTEEDRRHYLNGLATLRQRITSAIETLRNGYARHESSKQDEGPRSRTRVYGVYGDAGT